MIRPKLSREYLLHVSSPRCSNELFGYEPTVDIREGVEKFIAWYRDNEAWYDPLSTILNP